MAAASSAHGKDNLLVLFDIDGTLTVPRQSAKEDMLAALRQLRLHATVGVVGGSDLVKAKEQLGEGYVDIVDYAFPENGLQGFRDGREFHKMSFVGWLGEEKLKAFINFCLRYIADLDIPIKRGTFVEFRSGMLNVSPIGRNCSQQERCDFEAFDKQHKIRETFIAALKTAFPSLGLKYSIGGQISFDVFPEGWDKSYCLQHVPQFKDVAGKEIHFFGDKTSPGGNDYEIFVHPSVKGHTVTSPEDTMAQLKQLFPAAFSS